MNKTKARRSHSAEFKQKVCGEIRSGAIGRREAQRVYRLSDNLIQTWLAQANLEAKTPRKRNKASAGAKKGSAAYEDQIAVLERKVGQLTMALERRLTVDRD